MRIARGQQAPAFEVSDVNGHAVRLEDFSSDHVLLSFSRWAACPLCNLRIQLLTQRYPDLQTQGLRIISFFESSPKSILSHEIRQNAPFPLIGDPERKVYDQYGLELSWAKAIKTFFLPSVYKLIPKLPTTERGFPKRRDGKLARMPADFLLRPGLEVAHAHYGSHMGDHIPLKTVHDFLDHPVASPA